MIGVSVGPHLARADLPKPKFVASGVCLSDITSLSICLRRRLGAVDPCCDGANPGGDVGQRGGGALLCRVAKLAGQVIWHGAGGHKACTVVAEALGVGSDKVDGAVGQAAGVPGQEAIRFAKGGAADGDDGFERAQGVDQQLTGRRRGRRRDDENAAQVFQRRRVCLAGLGGKVGAERLCEVSVRIFCAETEIGKHFAVQRRTGCQAARLRACVLLLPPL